ncbi:MAG: sensor histidine kinase [Suilimivivens sp.]
MRRNKKRYSIRIQMMGINISITLICFLMYGGLFILSVSLLIGKYINADLDFFLTEISVNLAERYEYMEDMIYEIRNSDVLMEYLKGQRNAEERVMIENEFSDAVDISNSKNQRTEGMPLVEKVYLFCDNRDFVSSFYYSMTMSEIEQSDRFVTNIWEMYQKTRRGKSGFTTSYYEYESSLYMACPIMDDMMETCGTIIFETNRNTIRKTMDEAGNYNEAFWILYSEDGKCLEENDNDVQLSDFVERNRNCISPYTQEIHNKQYRLYHQELGFNMWILVGIPEDHAYKILADSLIFYVIMLFVVLVIGLLSFAVFTCKITKPVGEVTEKLKRVQEGDFETKLPDYSNKEFYEISNGFNTMTTEINHLIKEVYEKQLLLKELELKFLQSQLNPHFTFNVLNAIALQAKLDGNEKISRTISTFSQLIQAKIYRSDREEVQIKKELEYVKYYLEIQKFRYGERLSYVIDMDEKLMDHYIQKLSIQLIVENAVVHGLEPKMSNGNVSIRGFEEEGTIKIEIADDGVGFDADGEVELPLKEIVDNQEHNQVGLNNLNAILQLRYGKDYGLSIYSQKGRGTKVTICIPYLRKESR